MAATDPGSAVLWIHAAQPIAKDRAWKRPKRIFNNQSDIPLLYDLQITSSPDELVGGINAYGRLVRVPRSDSLRNDLLELYYSWRYMPPPKAAPPPEYRHYETGSTEWSGHESKINLAPLWAYRQILMLTQGHHDPNNALDTEAIDAPQLAMTYGIVTPVSSAVVTDPIVTPLPIKEEKTFLQSVSEAYSKALASLTNFDVYPQRKVWYSKMAEHEDKSFSQANVEPEFAQKAQSMLAEKKESNKALDTFQMPQLQGSLSGTVSDNSALKSGGKSLRLEGQRQSDEPANAIAGSALRAAVAPGYPASLPTAAPAAPKSSAMDEPQEQSTYEARRAFLKAKDLRKQDQLYEMGSSPQFGQSAPAPFTWPFQKPAPEPDTWLLLCGLGAVGGIILVFERRRKAAKQ